MLFLHLINGMNYLAHLVLSGKNEDVLFGNFIADAVKGKEYKKFNASIQKGILLHRFIDDFTDHHPKCLAGKRRMYAKLPKVSGILLDILYDHILLKNWEKYFSIEPDKFINSSYELLDAKIEHMPERISYMYHYMRKDNWLINYQYEWGLYRSIAGIEKRITPTINLEAFKLLFNENRVAYFSEFDAFFPDILEKSKAFLETPST